MKNAASVIACNPYYHNTDTHEKHQDVKTDKLAETNPMLMVSDFDANFCKVEKAKTITGPEDSITSSTSNYSTKTDSISSLEKSEDDGNETPTPSPRNSLSSLLSLDVSVIYFFKRRSLFLPTSNTVLLYL